jgi:hypothetical protein
LSSFLHLRSFLYAKVHQENGKKTKTTLLKHIGLIDSAHCQFAVKLNPGLAKNAIAFLILKIPLNFSTES